MLKFLILPFVGAILAAGTFFYESTKYVYGTTTSVQGDVISTSVPVVEPTDISGLEVIGSLNTKGFPFSSVSTAFATAENTQVEDDVRSLAGGDLSGMVGNWLFWTAIVTVGFLIFTKIRNIVGTLALIGIGVVAGLVYLGILVL